jgi:hypothetical protein
MGAPSAACAQRNVAQDRGLFFPRVRGEGDALSTFALLQDTYELGASKHGRSHFLCHQGQPRRRGVLERPGLRP